MLAGMMQAAHGENISFQVVLLAGERADFNEYIAYFKSKGISYIDCRLDELIKQEFQLPDGHPNGSMNEIIAGCIKQGLLGE